MPALKRRKKASLSYECQGCSASELGFKSNRRESIAPFVMGSRVRPAPDAGVACAGVGRTGRLSLGHIDTATALRGEIDTPAPSRDLPKPKLFETFPGGANSFTPGIPNLGHSSGGQSRPKSKRGKILTFSECSRRKLQSDLAKVRVSAELWTMCLTLPGYIEHLTHKNVKAAFLRFMKILTAMVARDLGFRDVAGFWKQELQGRNALHFHLILAGITDANRVRVWRWCAEHWIDCVMAILGMPPEIVLDEIRKMRAWHLFAGTKGKSFGDANFQKIRGNFHSYFAKYLGKDVEAHCASSPIPGRWWGKFNARRIPFAPRRTLELPERVCVHAQRVARKIRQARANKGKHAAICRKFGGMAPDDRTPGVSRQQLQRFYRAWEDLGGDVGLDADLAAGFAKLRLAAGSGLGSALIMFTRAASEGVRLSKLISACKLPAAMKFSGVRLTGAHIPAMMYRVLEYAGARALIDRERTPF